MSQQSHLPQTAPIRVARGFSRTAVQSWLIVALLALAAASIAAVVAQQWWRPLWADEVTTMLIVGAGSWSQLFEGVKAGLDSTPPLYTAFGWLLVQLGSTPDQVESGLRSLDSVLLVLFLSLAYRIGRTFLDRLGTALALGLFMLAGRSVLVALALDMRTYMVYLFFATASLCTGIGLLRRPTWTMGLANTVCLALLTFSHTVAIVYVMCLSGSLVLLHVARRDYRAVGAQAVRTVPALLIILSWVPVLRAQAQLGSYITKPDLYEFFKAFYIYPGTAVGLAASAALVFVLSPEVRRRGALPAARTVLSRTAALLSDSDKAYCLVVAGSFFLATCAVWLFSRLVFPVFAARYFEPNVLLLFIAVTMLVWCTGVLYGPAAGRTALITIGLAASAFAALFWRPEVERKIPCYDGVRNAFFEDEGRGDLPVLTLYSHAWLTRVGRRNEAVLYPSDTTMASDDPDDGAHAFEVAYMRRLGEWSRDARFKTTDELAGMTSGFTVLEDGKGGWLRRAQADPRFSFRLVASKGMLGRTCRLWKVDIAR